MTLGSQVALPADIRGRVCRPRPLFTGSSPTPPFSHLTTAGEFNCVYSHCNRCNATRAWISKRKFSTREKWRRKQVYPLAFCERSRAAKPHVRGDGNAIRNLCTANDQTAAFRGFSLLHNWTLRRIRSRRNVDSFIAAALAIIVPRATPNVFAAVGYSRV